MFESEGVQVSWGLIHTIFVELFTADLLKKSKFYHLSMERYLQNKLYFLKNLIFQKTCLRFSQKMGSMTHLQWHSTKVRHNVRHFFLFERA